jgi:hypothetical protein
VFDLHELVNEERRTRPKKAVTPYIDKMFKDIKNTHSQEKKLKKREKVL